MASLEGGGEGDGPPRVTLSRPDAAVKVGGWKAGLQRRRLNRSAPPASNSHLLSHLVNRPFMNRIHLYPAVRPASLPHITSQSVSCGECGGGRARAACSKQHLKRCLLSHQQSQRYWMTLSPVVNIICCMQARSPLVSCDSVSLGTWWQHTLSSKATIACLKVAQGPKYSSGLNSV